jgi:hypothetical protein
MHLPASVVRLLASFGLLNHSIELAKA